MRRLNRNDHTLVAYNAWSSATTAYDLVQLLHLPDDDAAHLHALLKEASQHLRRIWTENNERESR